MRVNCEELQRLFAIFSGVFLIFRKVLWEGDIFAYFLTSRRLQMQIVPMQIQDIKADTLSFVVTIGQ
ncbi:hypothetical protein ACN23B_24200 [Anabaena sp. FACHB-709]|uniref:Uncharacterized protein n=1 Tax=Anabaena cylindrica FACHB-318 TaxID=2692880 RepID=A0ABR7ZP85_ANACY|nr:MULTISPECIES: hypothetical protein [Nostocaceae]MBD2174404.1 hypothetical protein [Anabaena cylindrica FACHB-318]MBD2286490.1 hypothetical protein [Anabaena cylindrica FACHB-170]HBW32085.1 hypothetical protein [Nostoc sp. UBA8866]